MANIIVLQQLLASITAASAMFYILPQVGIVAKLSSARQNRDYHLLLVEFVFVPVMDAVVVGVILDFERPE
jgi:hypothetical protein